MAIPDYQTLMLPTLKVGATGVVHLRDAADILSNEYHLSEEERRQILPSGKMATIRNRVGWAITYLIKAELLSHPKRGYFTITDRGKKVLSENPDKINNKFLEQFPEFLEFKNKKKGDDEAPDSTIEDSSSATPEERIGSAYSEITAEIKSEILEKVLDGSPEFFEKLIVNLLVAIGYGGSSTDAGEHLGKSGDGGIDGVINEDKLGLDLIYVQAKRYAPDKPIGRPDIQKFAGSLIGKGANKGVFVTTSTFSHHADEYAETVPQRIILIDGEKLTALMLEHNVGVRVHQAIELKRIDEDFFIE